MSETVDQPPPPPPPSGEDWSARIEQLLTEAEAAPSVGERRDVLCRIAEIYERRLADPNGALVTLQAALEQDPTSGRVVQEMERVARSSGCWKELIAITAEVASGPGRPEAVGGPVGPDRVLERERPGAARRGGQRGARGAEPRAQPRRRAGAAGGSVQAAAQLGSLRRDPRRTSTSSRPEDPVQAAGGVPRGAALRAAARRARWPAWRALSEETADWETAADALRRLIAALPPGADEAERLQARHRLGAILKDRLGDARGAEEQDATPSRADAAGVHSSAAPPHPAKT